MRRLFSSLLAFKFSSRLAYGFKRHTERGRERKGLIILALIALSRLSEVQFFPSKTDSRHRIGSDLQVNVSHLNLEAEGGGRRSKQPLCSIFI